MFRIEDAIDQELIFKGSITGNLVPFTDGEFDRLGLTRTRNPALKLEVIHPVTKKVYASIFASDRIINYIGVLYLYNATQGIDEVAVPQTADLFRGLVLNSSTPFIGFYDNIEQLALQFTDGSILFGGRDYAGNGTAYLWVWLQ